MECTGPGWSAELEDLLARLEGPMWWGAGWSHSVCVPLPNVNRQVHKQLVIYFIPSKLVCPLETQTANQRLVCVCVCEYVEMYLQLAYLFLRLV